MKRGALNAATIVITSLFVVSCIITPANGALTWTIETVDSTGKVGKFASIALDNLGTPYISHFDQTNIDLKCAHSVSGLLAVTPESDGAAALLLSAITAVGCYVGVKRRTKQRP